MTRLDHIWLKPSCIFITALYILHDIHAAMGKYGLSRIELSHEGFKPTWTPLESLRQCNYTALGFPRGVNLSGLKPSWEGSILYLGGMLLCYKHEAQGLSAYNINNIPTGCVIGDI